MGQVRNIYKILVGKPECIMPHPIPKRGLEDNIKMNIRKIELEVVD
jgi:hypothetical protein